MVSIYIDYKLTRFQHEIMYAFSFIFQTLGYSFSFISETGKLKDNDILVIYGYTDPTVEELKTISHRYITIFIQCDPDLYDPGSFTPEKLRSSVRTIKLLSQTPVISVRKIEHPAENYSESNVHGGKINFDLAGNVFFHLAGLEAQIDSGKRQDGHYPDEASQFYAHRDTPYVNNLLWLVDSMIQEHTRAKGQCVSQKLLWPQGQQAAVTLSHTVDNLQKWNYSSLLLSVATDLALFATLKWRQLFYILAGKFRYLFTNYELYWNFDEFREMERDAGCRSTYYIATEKSEFINYHLDDADLQDELRTLQRQGDDIGLLLTGDKPTRDEFVSRKQIMLHQTHKVQIGIRQHEYLTNSQMRELHQAMKPAFSQSLACKEEPGFINGVAVPFKPWISGLSAEFLELPTVFHDAHLKLGRYKYLMLDSAKKELKKYYQNTLRSRGVFGMDFNLTSYTDVLYCKKLYAYALALVKSDNTWIATAQEIADWWSKREKVTVQESEYEISVYFPDELSSFCLRLHTDPRIREIVGVDCTVEGNVLRFSDIPAKSCAVIRLSKD